MQLAKLLKEKSTFSTPNENQGQPLTQISISDMSPRELPLTEMISLLEKVLDFEVNQVYQPKDGKLCSQGVAVGFIPLGEYFRRKREESTVKEEQGFDASNPTVGGLFDPYEQMY